MLLLERDMSVVDLQTPTVGGADGPDVPCRRLECHHSAPLPDRDNSRDAHPNTVPNDLCTIHSLSSLRILLKIGTLCV